MSYLFEPAEAPDRVQRLHQWVGSIGFVLLIALGPLVYFTLPPMRTHASVPPPVWGDGSFEDFRSGEYMQGWEKHLTEASPVTVWIRGCFNEALYHAHLLDAERVAIGKREWMFLRQTTFVDPNLRKKAAERRRFLRQLRAEAERLGVVILCPVVPDKVRVYPEHYFPAGRLPPARARLSADIVAELTAAGLPSVDLLGPFLEHRRQRPHELLYYRRDTHWTMAAAWLAGRVIRERIVELGWLDRAGPVLDFQAMAWLDETEIPDLVGMLGLREWGDLARRLSGAKTHMGFEHADGRTYGDDNPDAGVALVGTSFSAGGLHRSLPHELVRAVDCKGVLTGGGIVQGLAATLGRIRRGELKNCKIIVWEVIEHLYAEYEWPAPGF